MPPDKPSRPGADAPELWDEVKANLGSGWRVVLRLLVEGLPSSSEVYASFSSLARIRRLLAPFKRRLAVALAAVTSTALLVLVSPVAWRYMVDSIVPGGDPAVVTRITAILLVVYLFRAVTGLTSGYLLKTVALRVTMNLRIRLFEHLQTLSMTFFGERRTGELVSRLMSDVRAIYGTITGDLSGFLGQAVVFLGAMTMLLLTDWRLTVLMFLLVPMVSIVSTVVGRILRVLSARTTDEAAAVTSILEESIRSIRVVRSFVREPYEIRRFRAGVGELMALALKQVYLSVVFTPLVSTLFFASSVVIIWYGGRQVIAGELTIGQLVQFLTLTSVMGGAIRWFGDFWTRLQGTLGALDRLFALLDEKPDLVEAPGATVLPPIRGRLQLEGVTFRYAGSDTDALHDVSLEVEPGEVLAIVGPSGAGKTTLANLILRLYDPTEGRLSIDGIDIRSVTLASLRGQIGLVPQDTQLFAGTIHDNILYGRLEASADEVVAAARAASADEFISRMTHGYDSVVGERGTKLSGGQRQRIAIARALLKDPRLLVLDEATSALDTVSEKLVQQALDRLMAGRTTLVIAHRLSTIRNAHRIAVFDEGRLVELGAQADLLSSDGLYARLYRRKLEARDEEPAAAGEPAIAPPSPVVGSVDG